MKGTRALLFGRLFFGLRGAGLKVGLSDWMILMEALDRGAIRPDLKDFYQVARALLIKDEAWFDTWDQVFHAIFGDGALPVKEVEALLEWLSDPKPLPQLTPEQLAAMERHPLDKLRELFEERLREQDARHDGGNRWVGTGGTSPFGHGGRNPAGVRVGGSGGGRSAIQIAGERRFRAYRDDVVLDTRALGVALRRLRRLSRQEGEPQLDLDETISETCRQAGDLTLAFQPPRENEARVLLLMDVGGSMDPYSKMVERLFSAASNLHHWKSFEAHSFHNCVYEKLHGKRWGEEGIPTAQLLREHPPETFLIMVGDAAMAPSELTESWGAIDYWHENTTPGVMWLHRLRTRFNRAIWLNPMPARWWTSWTTRVIGQIFPMFPLTLKGLGEGVDTLRQRHSPPVPELDPALAGRR